MAWCPRDGHGMRYHPLTIILHSNRLAVYYKPSPATTRSNQLVLLPIFDTLFKPASVTLIQVRDVAPKKLMMCITFKLPEALCLKEGALKGLEEILGDGAPNEERDAKRAKT